MTAKQFVQFAKKKRRAINRRKRQIQRIESELRHAAKHLKDQNRPPRGRKETG